LLSLSVILAGSASFMCGISRAVGSGDWSGMWIDGLSRVCMTFCISVSVRILLELTKHNASL
jgi:hypothetical protein